MSQIEYSAWITDHTRIVVASSAFHTTGYGYLPTMEATVEVLNLMADGGHIRGQEVLAHKCLENAFLDSLLDLRDQLLGATSLLPELKAMIAVELETAGF